MYPLKLRIATLGAYIIMVATNYTAVLLPLGGRSTGQISDDYANLFAPAGYAFSIWGLIYTLLGIYVIRQFWGEKDHHTPKINSLFIVNALLNASWIITWHYDFIWLSVFIMLGLLVSLIKIADIFRDKEKRDSLHWISRLAFGIYFGWITVATIANITVLLVKLGWNGLGLSESFWTITVLLVGMIIGTLRMRVDRYAPYGMVLIWAYGAILFKHLSARGFNGMYPSIIYTSAICLVVFIGVLFLIKRKSTIFS